MENEININHQICDLVGKATFLEKSGKTMDLRIEKTKHSICNAFIELRSHKTLERITVKELCELAQINKSTFYAHYVDIYDLSEKIESDIISTVIRNLGNIEDALLNPSAFSHKLSLEYTAQNALISIIFSGSRREQLPQKLQAAIKEQVFAKFPEYANSPEKNIMLTYSVYGGYFAYCENQEYDDNTIVKIIGDISKKVVS